MENDDLKNIWSAFNKNIDSVEKTNKRILSKMISRKSEIRLQIMKFQSLLGFISAPLILYFVIVPMIIRFDKTNSLIIGAFLTILVFIYGFVQAIKNYKLIVAIKPAFEPVIKTQERLITLKKFRIKLQKHRNIIFPILSCGLILIIWDKIDYSLPLKIILLLGMSVGIYFWGNLKHKLYFQDRIKLVELEMEELKEYQ